MQYNLPMIDDNAIDQPGSSATVPLVRLSLLLPFVEELERRLGPANVVLLQQRLAREAVDNPDVFVPPLVIHRFLEAAADALQDPCFSLKVGEQFQLDSWPPFLDAAVRATTLGEFLTRFIHSAADEASSARHTLEIGPKNARFREIRSHPQAIPPAQNDAFTAAYVLRLLRRGAGSAWNPAAVLLTVCDPDALPPGYLGVTVSKGDRQGLTVRFPSPWLVQSVDRKQMLQTPPGGRKASRVPRQFLDALRHILMLRLDDPRLNVEQVAGLSGVSRQSLQRRLRSAGTTFSAELGQLKQQRAQELLTETTRSVGDIASAVGFANATSFTRAFKAWVGISPRDYRKQQRR